VMDLLFLVVTGDSEIFAIETVPVMVQAVFLFLTFGFAS
jgi:hypothetical protein